MRPESWFHDRPEATPTGFTIASIEPLPRLEFEPVAGRFRTTEVGTGSLIDECLFSRVTEYSSPRFDALIDVIDLPR